MQDTVITADRLTKDYGSGRGVFDISLNIRKGEIFGFLGTNGSGKTTTIRSLLGFIKPDGGACSVLGMDSWEKSAEIMNYVSYIPGEIAFPSLPTGTAFLKNQAQFLDVDDYTAMNKVIKELKLDASADLKRMSKGMKQKTAITAALMSEKEILILDEPTTGLDPLMRDAFLNLIRSEKAKGHTVLMSGHIFEEIETICDRAAMIKDGKIIDITDLNEAKHSRGKQFIVEFENEKSAKNFSEKITSEVCGNVCKIFIPSEKLQMMFRILKQYKCLSLQEKHFSLEEHFMKTYEREARQ